MNHQVPALLSKCPSRPVPALAGAYELIDVRALLREWVTTIAGKAIDPILEMCSIKAAGNNFPR